MGFLDITSINNQNNMYYGFAGFPDAKIYADEHSKKWIQHLLFGDYIEILGLEITNSRIHVMSRNKSGWIHVDKIRKERVLEVNFIDIGQGDGCHLVTPDDEHYIIDAGKGDNLYRYLYWRFNLDENDSLPFKFNGIISHPDNDHFLGFGDLFESEAIQFKVIYHSGVVQRPKSESNGWNTQLGKVEKLSDGKKYLSSIVNDHNEFQSILEDQNNLSGSGSQYVKTLAKVLKQCQTPSLTSLNSSCGYLMGQGNDDQLSIEVLAPICKNVGGKTVLPYFGSLSKTKNGHSVLLKLKYKKLKLMLGGDINEKAGDYINSQLGQNAKSVLQVDIAKACHHGSHLFSYEFLENINALGTVISSGDDENYSHPRPDTLGAIGKTGYSRKPLIFSTELARSNKEFSTSTIPELIRKYQSWEKAKKEFEDFQDSDDGTSKNSKKMEELKADMVARYKKINSYLTRHGMISLRSDGIKMIVAQKLERDAASGKYDIYEFEYNATEDRFVRIT